MYTTICIYRCTRRLATLVKSCSMKTFAPMDTNIRVQRAEGLQPVGTGRGGVRAEGMSHGMISRSGTERVYVRQLYKTEGTMPLMKDAVKRPSVKPSLKQLRAEAVGCGVPEREVNLALDKEEVLELIRERTGGRMTPWLSDQLDAPHPQVCVILIMAMPHMV